MLLQQEKAFEYGARLPLVIPGTDAVACASDRGGEDGLDVIPADGSAARRIGQGVFGRIMELAVAPDGRTAAVACADGRLLTVALDGEPVITEIARSANEEVAGLLREYAELTQITGGDVFRARNYEKAARSVRGWADDVSQLDAKGLQPFLNPSSRPVFFAGSFDGVGEVTVEGSSHKDRCLVNCDL